MRPEDFTFRFVAQPGHLALYGRVLASSLRRFAPAGVVIEACVPEPMTLDANTLALFERLGVEVRGFEPAIWHAHGYPIGNKVDVAALPFATARLVLMDTDMIAIRPFDLQDLGRGALAMRTIMGAQVFVEANRAAIAAFAARHVARADRRALATHLAIRTPARVGFPVFNSGLIVFAHGLGLGDRLRELTIAALTSEALPAAVQRPFADQLALAALALERPEIVAPLDHHWNCAINRTADYATIWHYFSFPLLVKRPFGRKLLLSLQEEPAKSGINLLGEISKKDIYSMAS